MSKSLKSNKKEALSFFFCEQDFTSMYGDQACPKIAPGGDFECAFEFRTGCLYEVCHTRKPGRLESGRDEDVQCILVRKNPLLVKLSLWTERSVI